MKKIMEISYAGMGGSWTDVEYSTLLSLFPKGQICIEDRGIVVAAAFLPRLISLSPMMPLQPRQLQTLK